MNKPTVSNVTFTGNAKEVIKHAHDGTLRLVRHGKKGYRWNVVSVDKVISSELIAVTIEGPDGDRMAGVTSDRLLFDPVSQAWADGAAKKAGSANSSTPAEEEAYSAILASFGIGTAVTK